MPATHYYSGISDQRLNARSTQAASSALMPIFADDDLGREFRGYRGDREPTPGLIVRFVKPVASDMPGAEGAACAESARLVLQSRIASTPFFLNASLTAWRVTDDAALSPSAPSLVRRSRFSSR
jgi:hypothetical protein